MSISQLIFYHKIHHNCSLHLWLKIALADNFLLYISVYLPTICHLWSAKLCHRILLCWFVSFETIWIPVLDALIISLTSLTYRGIIMFRNDVCKIWHTSAKYTPGITCAKIGLPEIPINLLIYRWKMSKNWYSHFGSSKWHVHS